MNLDIQDIDEAGVGDLPAWSSQGGARDAEFALVRRELA